MALHLRRSLIFSSSLLNHLDRRPLSLSKPHYRRPHSSPSITSSSFLQSPSHFLVPSMSFRSSSFSLSQSRYSNDKEDEKISPDTILFEGCDYNHWLITMEFPKDPKPTPEEMVETYVQTLAKVVGSVEEAKKRMYACSTTTYHGFQAVMTETMSEMFRGLPGVVFILPDSYIDPVNKEYGGDKYINGTIIPRPPPVHYTRGDRNRYRTQNPMPMQQGNTRSDNRNSMQGDGRNYAPQNHYGPTGQDGRGFGPPAGRDFNPAMERRDFQQVERRDYGQAGGSDYNAQGGRRDYGQAGGSDYNAQGGQRDPMPMGGRDYAPGGYQGERREPVPSYQRDYNQGERGNYIPQERRDFSQREQRDYPPPERRDFGGNYRDAGPSGGVDYRQRMGSGYGQGFTGPNEGQMFSQMEDRDGMQGEHRNFAPVEQPGTGQGRY